MFTVSFPITATACLNPFAFKSVSILFACSILEAIEEFSSTIFSLSLSDNFSEPRVSLITS
jgi:hypothetical protein